MDVFFENLGRTVLQRWKRVNFSLEKFPEIAKKALEETPPSEQVDLATLIEDFLLNDERPQQSQSGFGQPELVAYDHPRFYIQILFWMDGTTDIHQHEFSGAFHVMHGSSIHAHFTFENGRSVTPYLRLGDVCMKRIELLPTGRTVPIISGSSCIHSLFHLDTPSVTVVVRTHNDPGTAPQFNYLPPHIAMDPMHNDTLTMRRKQLLDMLEQTGDPGYAEIVHEMIKVLDFERGFYVLQHCMGHLQYLGGWLAVLGTFRKKHGALAAGVAVTLEEGMRRDRIKEMRGRISDPEQRFFLALLMNAPTRASVVKLVRQRFPEQSGTVTIQRWTQELTDETDTGVIILDAVFPESLEVEIDKQSELFHAALNHFMSGGKKLPSSLSHLQAGQIEQLRGAFTASSLRVLVDVRAVSFSPSHNTRGSA